ncbi:hypothetical protein SapgrDRAFT_2162 [Saprospira grandis DSM 2844]|uniref:Uncharacterized protein n=1 Tax=Saprospira grandis DSM 2844 TaxID=694433 RepID=J0P8F7_9BACT|nr:hypothetical protein [Saprospira grandis]EJF53842.1 hypothetical protein SapgrDRAFT_2162 [Saprospira grandis DSM 2844]
MNQRSLATALLFMLLPLGLWAMAAPPPVEYPSTITGILAFVFSLLGLFLSISLTPWYWFLGGLLSIVFSFWTRYLADTDKTMRFWLGWHGLWQLILGSAILTDPSWLLTGLTAGLSLGFLALAILQALVGCLFLFWAVRNYFGWD